MTNQRWNFLLIIFMVCVASSSYALEERDCADAISGRDLKRPSDIIDGNSFSKGTYTLRGSGIFIYRYSYEQGADGLIRIYIHELFQKPRLVGIYKAVKEIPPAKFILDGPISRFFAPLD